FGALVAFEVAQCLSSSGLPLPVRLCVSGARAPHLRPREEIHDLPEPEFMTRLMRYGGVPKEVLDNHELLSLLMPIVRDDFRLFQQFHYQPGGALQVPISVFGGLQDPEVPASDLLGWSIHTTKSFRSRFYPGRHFFLFDQKLPVLDDVQNDVNASLIS